MPFYCFQLENRLHFIYLFTLLFSGIGVGEDHASEEGVEMRNEMCERGRALCLSRISSLLPTITVLTLERQHPPSPLKQMKILRQKPTCGPKSLCTFSGMRLKTTKTISDLDPECRSSYIISLLIWPITVFLLVEKTFIFLMMLMPPINIDILNCSLLQLLQVHSLVQRSIVQFIKFVT